MNNELAKINEQGEIEIAENVMKELKKFYQTKAKVDVMEDRLKSTMLELMEQIHATDFVSNDGLIKIKYIPSTTSKKLDQKKLKEEKPSVYAKYLKDSSVKAYVKIIVK